jgi:cleavage stimulation factor subunit 3
MELDSDNLNEAEAIFGAQLMNLPNVEFWSLYLNYVRRRQDLTNDPTGNARTTVSQAYDFVLNNIGIDRNSGQLWSDYIQFLKGTPGQIGGQGWQDQQKADNLRKAFRRAISTPMTTVNNLWKDYDQFENTQNRATVSYIRDAKELHLILRRPASSSKRVLQRT